MRGREAQHRKGLCSDPPGASERVRPHGLAWVSSRGHGAHLVSRPHVRWRVRANLRNQPRAHGPRGAFTHTWYMTALRSEKNLREQTVLSDPESARLQERQAPSHCPWRPGRPHLPRPSSPSLCSEGRQGFHLCPKTVPRITESKCGTVPFLSPNGLTCPLAPGVEGRGGGRFPLSPCRFGVWPGKGPLSPS